MKGIRPARQLNWRTAMQSALSRERLASLINRAWKYAGSTTPAWQTGDGLALMKALAVLVLTWLPIWAGAAQSDNLARGKPYLLEPAPNYATPVAVPAGALTDGLIATTDAHWVNGLSHGWQSVAPVTVELDLQATRSVGEVRLHVTHSPSVDILWPSSAYLFESADGYRYRPVPRQGRLVTTTDPGASIVKGYLTFDLQGDPVRRLVLAVFANPMLFLDELEAFPPGAGGIATGPGAAPSGAQTRPGAPAASGQKGLASSGSNEPPGLLRKELAQAIRTTRNATLITPLIEDLARQDRLASDLRERRSPPWLFSRWGDAPPTATAAAATVTKGSTGVASAHRLAPRDADRASCQVRRVLPWQSFRPATPPRPMPAAFDGTDLTLVGQPAYFAWEITNTGKAPAVVRDLPMSRANDQGLEIESRLLGYVATARPAIVGDLLLAPRTLTLPPGESVVVLLQARPRKPGPATLATRFHCDDKAVELTGRLDALPFTPPAPAASPAPAPGAATRGAAPAPPAATTNPPDPFFTLWAYRIEPLKHGLTCRPGLLADIGVDVAIIHSSSLGDIGAASVASDLLQQLRASAGMRRVVLFMDFREAAPAWTRGNDADLAAGARRWLKQLQSLVERSGFTGEVLLYPYDELRPEEADAFARVRNEFRKGPYRLFGTLNDERMLGFRKQLDVPSISFTGNVVDRAELRREEFYLAEGDAKERSPSRYYYSTPIVAAVRGSPGFGLWALVDSSGASAFEQGWSDVGIGERDFGMLYFERTGCPMPSLRLAALNAGRTAQRILHQCAANAPGQPWRAQLEGAFGNPARLKDSGDLDDAALGQVLGAVSACAAALPR